MTAATHTADSAIPPSQSVPQLRWLGLRIVLILLAAMEAFDAFPSASILFGDMSEIPGPGFGGFLIKTHLATHPVLSIAVIAFAAIGRVRFAIMALAAIAIMTWLNYMPSVVLHGFEANGIGALQTAAQIIAFPLMGACAIALAARDQKLWLAAALAGIPTLFNLLGVVVFAISVMIYGFRP